MKLSGGIPTRNFKNYKHPTITEGDYEGDRSIVGNQYKLILKKSSKGTKSELYDLRKDPAEKNNLSDAEPEITNRLQQELKQWQDSVLKSLTGADYQ